MVNENLCPGCSSPVRYPIMNSPQRHRDYHGRRVVLSTPRRVPEPALTFVEEPGLSSRQATAAVAAIAWAILLIAAGAMSMVLSVACFTGHRPVLIDIDNLHRFDDNTWGWFHLALGATLIICGAGLIGGRIWARMGSVVCAMASIVIDFAWLPHYPGWAAVVITVKMAAILAVATWRPADM
ncbi:hypothetical protein [Nocardia sp. NPDC005366]|uniref:DUF7144 family membrane protein n=1 Tax=Nocardia sp. NPDC005366 TaxID=3156878 RepID=UPI0033A6AC67